MSEPRDVKIKRLAMRSMRRGIKEMDLILSSFADAHLADLSDADLATYDAMIEESDHDLYQWVCGGSEIPKQYASLMERISAGAKGIVRPGLR